MPKTVRNTNKIEDKFYPQPECYEQGFVAADVFGQSGQYCVVSEGERLLAVADRRLVRTPTEFREFFTLSGGETPDDCEWEYNAWWEVYEVTDEGWGPEGEVFFDLNEAIAYAEEQAA